MLDLLDHVFSNNYQVIKELLEQDNMDFKPENIGKALIIAIEKGHSNIAYLLLIKCDIDIDVCNDKGYNILTVAAIHGNPIIVNLLLQYCYKVCQNNEHHEKCLYDFDTYKCITFMYAASFGSVKVVNLLVEKYGIDVNSYDIQGYTALMYAAHYGCLEVVKSLLEYEKLEIYLRDDNNEDALIKAIKGNHWQIADLLLKKVKLDIDIMPYYAEKMISRSITPFTLLMLAIQKNQVDIVKLLIEFLNFDLKLFTSISCDAKIDLSPLAYAITCYIDSNYSGAKGAKHIRNNYLEIIKLILQCKGIDINQDIIDEHDIITDIVLTLPMQHGLSEIVMLLLQYQGQNNEDKLNVNNCINNPTLTPLIYALEQFNKNTEDDLQIIRKLLELGANVNVIFENHYELCLMSALIDNIDIMEEYKIYIEKIDDDQLKYIFKYRHENEYNYDDGDYDDEDEDIYDEENDYDIYDNYFKRNIIKQGIISIDIKEDLTAQFLHDKKLEILQMIFSQLLDKPANKLHNNRTTNQLRLVNWFISIITDVANYDYNYNYITNIIDNPENLVELLIEILKKSNQVNQQEEILYFIFYRLTEKPVIDQKSKDIIANCMVQIASADIMIPFKAMQESLNKNLQETTYLAMQKINNIPYTTHVGFMSMRRQDNDDYSSVGMDFEGSSLESDRLLHRL